MSTSNAWAEFAGVFCRTRSAFLEHETAKAELKGLLPGNAKDTGTAFGPNDRNPGPHFDVLSQEEADHAPVQ